MPQYKFHWFSLGKPEHWHEWLPLLKDFTPVECDVIIMSRVAGRCFRIRYIKQAASTEVFGSKRNTLIDSRYVAIRLQPLRVVDLTQGEPETYLASPDTIPSTSHLPSEIESSSTLPTLEEKTVAACDEGW